MNNEFTLFIDESGDDGITEKSSPYFIFGGFIIRNTNINKALSIIDNIKNETNIKKLHFNDMSHYKKAYACRQISKLPILAFATISSKSTLGAYKIENKWEYYNKNAHYFLEMVGNFIQTKIINEDSIIDIIFEEKHNIEYGKLKGFIYKIKKTPLHDNAKYLQKIDENRICCKTKANEPMLQIADCIASATQSAINETIKEHYFLSEHRYLEELSSKFYADDEGKIYNKGVKIIKQGVNSQDTEFIKNFKNIINRQCVSNKPVIK